MEVSSHLNPPPRHLTSHHPLCVCVSPSPSLSLSVCVCVSVSLSLARSLSSLPTAPWYRVWMAMAGSTSGSPWNVLH